MATFWRLATRQGRILASICRHKKVFYQPACFISTSKKNKDGITTQVDPMHPKTEIQKKLEEHFAESDPSSEKNWISFGYDFVDKDFDRFAHNMTMFIFISVCLVGGSFLFAYMPDHRLEDWSIREAYLELERRQKAGLPLVDPNMIPLDAIELPSDEEIGDTEIII
ncbi:hypothetical protein ScPMuIL_007918 [Solemya velum]